MLCDQRVEVLLKHERVDDGATIGPVNLDHELEQTGNDLFLHLVHHLVEHLMPLGAVLDDRVLLGEATQMDAVAQVVHVVEMLAPAGVDRLQQIEALGTAHQLGIDLLDHLLLAVVGGRGIGDGAVDQRFGVDLTGGAEIGAGKRDRVDRA